MEKLQVVHVQEVVGKELKVYGDLSNPLFLAKDVAEWIEYDTRQLGKMLTNVDEDEKVRNNVTTLGGTQETWFLTEDGLYEVLMQSRKPIAKQFKKQVKQILKTLRKDGMYVSGEESMSDEELYLITLERLKSKIDRLTLENKELDRTKNKIQKGMTETALTTASVASRKAKKLEKENIKLKNELVNIVESLEQVPTLTSFTAFSKQLGIPIKKLYVLAENLKLIEDVDGRKRPTTKAINHQFIRMVDNPKYPNTFMGLTIKAQTLLIKSLRMDILI